MNQITMEYANLKPLNNEELLNINGGKPTEKTGFWYDVTYYTTEAVIFVGKAFLNGAAAIKG